MKKIDTTITVTAEEYEGYIRFLKAMKGLKLKEEELNDGNYYAYLTALSKVGEYEDIRDNKKRKKALYFHRFDEETKQAIVQNRNFKK